MIKDMSDDLRNATAEIRRLVYDLRPPMLDELGLIEALKNTFAQNGDLDIEMRMPGPIPDLAAAVEVAVFRIASEAVYNVIKHAEASHCTISFEHADNQLCLSIMDDGCGLPDDMRYGVGLISIRERAEELGGHMKIENRHEGGAQLSVRLPIEGPQGWIDSVS
jgi:two-component system NarL family sensor kinase